LFNSEVQDESVPELVRACGRESLLRMHLPSRLSSSPTMDGLTLHLDEQH
jgi:hypothetical protein